MMPATVSNGSWKTSWTTNAVRSAGVRRSSVLTTTVLPTEGSASVGGFAALFTAVSIRAFTRAGVH
jgi:hypothetical protein